MHDVDATILDALTETIIPADEHSPGAREARVADYIDLLLAESDDPTCRRAMDYFKEELRTGNIA